MIIKITYRNGEKVIEMRSDGGRLLFIKTKKGYEIKCPRTKKICLVKYEEMFTDYVSSLKDGKPQNAKQELTALLNILKQNDNPIEDL